MKIEITGNFEVKLYNKNKVKHYKNTILNRLKEKCAYYLHQYFFTSPCAITNVNEPFTVLALSDSNIAINIDESNGAANANSGNILTEIPFTINSLDSDNNNQKIVLKAILQENEGQDYTGVNSIGLKVAGENRWGSRALVSFDRNITSDTSQPAVYGNEGIGHFVKMEIGFTTFACKVNDTLYTFDTPVGVATTNLSAIINTEPWQYADVMTFETGVNDQLHLLVFIDTVPTEYYITIPPVVGQSPFDFYAFINDYCSTNNIPLQWEIVTQTYTSSLGTEILTYLQAKTYDWVSSTYYVGSDQEIHVMQEDGPVHNPIQQACMETLRLGGFSKDGLGRNTGDEYAIIYTAPQFCEILNQKFIDLSVPAEVFYSNDQNFDQIVIRTLDVGVDKSIEIVDCTSRESLAFPIGIQYGETNRLYEYLEITYTINFKTDTTLTNRFLDGLTSYLFNLDKKQSQFGLNMFSCINEIPIKQWFFTYLPASNLVPPSRLSDYVSKITGGKTDFINVKTFNEEFERYKSAIGNVNINEFNVIEGSVVSGGNILNIKRMFEIRMPIQKYYGNVSAIVIIGGTGNSEEGRYYLTGIGLLQKFPYSYSDYTAETDLTSYGNNGTLNININNEGEREISISLSKLNTAQSICEAIQQEVTKLKALNSVNDDAYKNFICRYENSRYELFGGLSGENNYLCITAGSINDITQYLHLGSIEYEGTGINLNKNSTDYLYFKWTFSII